MPRLTFCYHCRKYVSPELVRVHLALAQEDMEEAAREREEEDD